MPWQGMAIWMLTQLRRWGYVKGEVDYAALAQQVFRLSDARRAMQSLGETVPADPAERFEVMGRTFDARRPDAYLKALEQGARA